MKLKGLFRLFRSFSRSLNPGASSAVDVNLFCALMFPSHPRAAGGGKSKDGDEHLRTLSFKAFKSVFLRGFDVMLVVSYSSQVI